jgi:hypothetical protein
MIEPQIRRRIFMRIKSLSFIIGVTLALGIGAVCFSQTTSVFSVGLNHPTKITLGAGNSLLVSEAGTFTANTGRISIVDRFTGNRSSLIEGLPSGVSNLGGPPDADGPSGLLLNGNTLYVTVGVGDAVINVGPGLELPANNPSSPIFNSVMAFTLPGGYQDVQSPFTMTLADQSALEAGNKVILTNSEGKTALVKLIADLPDYRSEPRMGHPDNVRAGHLFGVEMFQKDLYIVDAAFNVIHKVNLEGGGYTTFIEFANRPNPLFPMLGGPFIEPVPDNIHRWGNRLLVPLLTGFPFVGGLSEVRAVDLKGAQTTVLIPNLSSAIDVLRIGDESDPSFAANFGGSFYTLEFSVNQLGGLPGRLSYYSSASSAPVVVSPALITPTSMARDGKTGDIFVTNIFPGTVSRVQFP